MNTIESIPDISDELKKYFWSKEGRAFIRRYSVKMALILVSIKRKEKDRVDGYMDDYINAAYNIGFIEGQSYKLGFPDGIFTKHVLNLYNSFKDNE